MNLLSGVRKAASQGLQVFGSTSRFTRRSIFTGLLSGTKLDYIKEQGRIWDNSVAGPGISWIWRNLTYPRLIVERDTSSGKTETVVSHPFVGSIENGYYYDDTVLWHGCIVGLMTHGNAYALPRFANNGQPIGYLYVPPTRCFPVSGDDELIAGYRYTPIGGVERLIPRESVVHFRWGQDPEWPLLGLSPMYSAARETYGENLAGTLMAALLKNAGIAGVAVSPKGDAAEDITPDRREKLEDKWVERTTGDLAGRPMFMPFPMDVNVIGFSPDQLALDKTRAIQCSRICAAIGLDPMVLGLPSDSKTYSNYSEAVEGAYEGLLMPLLHIIAKQMTAQMLRRYYSGSESLRVGWDTSNVRALQEDENELFTRWGDAYQKGIARRKNAHAKTGQEFDETDDDVFITDAQMGVTGAAKQLFRDARQRAIERSKYDDDSDEASADSASN